MASVLNKDPFTYAEDRQRFLQDLQRFHASRGTPFDRIPQIGGRDVDLYRLYRRVIDLGGWQKLNNEQLWEDIIEEFGIPVYCANGTQALKHIYFRYLHIYEKVHFLGVDPDQVEESQDDGPSRKKVCLPIESVPLFYNYAQHRVPESARAANHLDTNLVRYSDYEKLEMSLRSGLPNEVDFAINVCLLLSNEGRHVLKLGKSVHLISLLLANIGVFEEGAGSMEDVLMHSWRTTSKRDFLRFWHEAVKDEKTRELIKTKNGVYTREDPLGHEVLNLGRNPGVSDAEGQRVTQLAVLIRNLSFEVFNQDVLASNPLVFRFLMLCVHSTFGSLKQLALDTLGNLASQIILEPFEKSVRTQQMLNLIKNSLVEEDKFAIVRGLEILSKLAQLEKNENVLNDSLEPEMYERIVQLLTVHDIQLIVHTLEALYQLSELGDTTTTMIADVKNAVDLLVNLITVEAQSYGPNSLIGIKVVEYVPPPELQNASAHSSAVHHSHSIQSVAPSHSYHFPAQPAVHQPPSAEQQKTDLETTASNWLQATFELKKGCCVTQGDLYTDYKQFCRKFGVPDTLTSTDFSTVVKSAFPQVDMASVEKGEGEKELVVKGLAKRAIPRPFAIQAGSDRVSKSFSVNAARVPPMPPGMANWSQPLGVNTNMSPNSMPAPSPPVQTPTLRRRLMEPPRMSLQQQLANHAGTTARGAPSTASKPVIISSTGKPGQPVTPKPPDKSGQKKRQSTPAPTSGPGPGPGVSAASPRAPGQMAMGPPGQVAARPPGQVAVASTVGQRPVSMLQHHLQVAGAPQPAASIMQPITTDQVLIQSSSAPVLSSPAPTLPVSTAVPAAVTVNTTLPHSVPAALSSSTTVSSTTSTPLSSPGQQFPLIHQALQGDGLPPSSFGSRPALSQADQNDTNLIKSLLAKKVCQNMVRQTHSPTPQDGQSETMDIQTSQEAQDQTSVHQQPQETQQNQQFIQQPQVQAAVPQQQAVVSSQPVQQVPQVPQGQPLLMTQQQQQLHQQLQQQQFTQQLQKQQQQQSQGMGVPQLPQPHQLTQQVQLQLQQKVQHPALQLQTQQLLLQTRPQQLILQQGQIGGQQQLVIQSQPTLQQILHQPIQQLHIQPQSQALQLQAQSQPLQIQAQSQPIQIQAQSQPLQMQAPSQQFQIQAQSQPLQIQAQSQSLQIQAQSQSLQIQPQPQPVQMQPQGQTLQIQNHSQPLRLQSQSHALQIQAGGQQQPQHNMMQTFQIQLPVYGLPQIATSQIATVSSLGNTSIVQAPGAQTTANAGARLTLPHSSSGAPYRNIVPTPTTTTAPSTPSQKPFTFAPGPFSSKVLSFKTKKSNSRPSSPKVTNKPNQGQGLRSESPLAAAESEASRDSAQPQSVENKEAMLHGALSAPSSNLQTMLAGAQTNSAVTVSRDQTGVTVNPVHNPLLMAGGTVVQNPARPTASLSTCLSLPHSSVLPSPFLSSTQPSTLSSSQLAAGRTTSMSITQSILASSAQGNVVHQQHSESQVQSGLAHTPMDIRGSQAQVGMGNGQHSSVAKECNGVAGYPTQGEANGVLGSPSSVCSDMPPSPVCEGMKKVTNSEQNLPNGLAEGSINNLKECSRSKDLLNSVVEKAAKMNGLVHHMENGSAGTGEEWRVPKPGENVQAGETDMQVDSKDSLQSGHHNGRVDSVREPGVTAPISHRDREQVLVKQTSMEEVSMDSMDVQVSVGTGKMLLNGGKSCEAGRPLFSPDSSRDSDMSSDSLASSIAESTASDKHSAAFAKPTTLASATQLVTTPSLDDSSEPASKKNKKSRTKSAESDKKQPAKSKKRKGSNASNPGSDTPTAAAPGVPVLEYMCEWAGCKRCFTSARLVFIHATKTHVPHTPEAFCQWEGCEPLQRKRWSLVTHLQDHHCSEMAQRQACHRRFQQAQAAAAGGANQAPANPPQAPALVYPPDAALQAIKRFHIRPPFPEFSEPREGPVTKHIRLTAALILRNLARYSSHGRSLIKHWERRLSYATMSAVESSTALSNCLYEILHDT